MKVEKRSRRVEFETSTRLPISELLRDIARSRRGPTVCSLLDDDRLAAGGVRLHALATQDANADVLVLPSRRDGFGVAPNQAAAPGRHPVATDRTGALGLVEPVGPEAPVTLVLFGDVSALKDALVPLEARRGEPHAQGRLGSAPRRNASMWRKYAPRYEQSILRAVANRSSAR